MDLYIVRHGESEQNRIVHAIEHGDEDNLLTQDAVTVPDRSWRLTPRGRKQADCIGRWIVENQNRFDKYYVSPFIRTRETAATLALPHAKWIENRVIRERSWGEISTITNEAFQRDYGRNWNFKQNDPLYWRPPAGESIADVAEDRVHNFLSGLSKNAEGETVIAVSHGDFMTALMLVMEDISDEEFLRRSDSAEWKISNCTCLHYSRRNPFTGETSKRIGWEQTATPVFNEETNRFEVRVKPWRQFKRQYLSNGDLTELAHAEDLHL